MNIKKPKLIIYDWDNTVIDTSRLFARIINSVRRDNNMTQLSVDEILQSKGDPDSDWILNLFGEYSDENAQKYDYYYESEHAKFNFKFMPGAKAVIEIAGKLGIYQSVLTNKHKTFALKELNYLDLTQKIGTFLSIPDALRKKPDPIGIYQIVSDAESVINDKINKDEIWFIGDNLIDAECAMQYRCLFFYIGNMLHIKKKYLHFIKKHFNMSDIYEILKKYD